MKKWKCIYSEDMKEYSHLSAPKIYFPWIIQETDKLPRDSFACIVTQAIWSLKKEISVRNSHQPDNIPEPWQSSGGREETFLCISTDECDSWKRRGTKSESETAKIAA